MGARYLPFLGGMELEAETLEVGGGKKTQLLCVLCVACSCMCVHRAPPAVPRNQLCAGAACISAELDVCINPNSYNPCTHRLTQIPIHTTPDSNTQVVRLAMDIEPALLAPAARALPDAQHSQVRCLKTFKSKLIWCCGCCPAAAVSRSFCSSSKS